LGTTGGDVGRRALATWTAYVVVGFGVKLFVAATSAWRFGRSLAFADVACSLGGDALIAGALLLVIVGATRLARPVSWLGSGVLALAALVAIALQLVYPLCGYVFWVWGAFLEPLHLDAGRRAGASADLAEFVLDRKMVAAALVFAAGLALTRFFASRFREPAARRRVATSTGCVVAALAIGSSGPWRRPGSFDPSTPSPLLLFASGLEDTAGGLDARRWPEVREEVAAFVLPPARPVPDEYASLRGAARDLDLLFVVLESTRRDRLSIYGCERETTPNLRAMLGHSLVLDEAYVSQPRSCKTMESLLLGTYPDPRLVSLTWTTSERPVADSLLRRFADARRRLYFGTAFSKETDGFDQFVERAAGRPLDRSVGGLELGTAVRPDVRRRDDRTLVDDYLAWRASVGGPSAAILWLGGAHHPYRAVEQPFGEETLLDRYDNGVWCSDRAIGRLVEGLERGGRAEHTLLVVLGDHGEALGEHLDVLHGSFLYDHSIRIPCVFWSPSLFASGARCGARFCVKDLAATLLWMAGDERPIGQSHVLFGNRRDDPLYLSNVFQDYKLGVLRGDRKVTFRTARDELWLHDLAHDPREERDPEPVEHSAETADLDATKRELVAFYYSQLRALGVDVPAAAAPSR
jgi:hypothetical protein